MKNHAFTLLSLLFASAGCALPVAGAAGTCLGCSDADFATAPTTDADTGEDAAEVALSEGGDEVDDEVNPDACVSVSLSEGCHRIVDSFCTVNVSCCHPDGGDCLSGCTFGDGDNACSASACIKMLFDYGSIDCDASSFAGRTVCQSAVDGCVAKINGLSDQCSKLVPIGSFSECKGLTQ